MAETPPPGTDQLHEILLSHLTTPALLLDEGSHFVSFNNAAARLFGLTTEEMRAQLWAGVDAHLTLMAWKQNWKKLLRADSLVYETDVVTSTDLLRPVRVHLSLLDARLALVELTDLISVTAAQDQLNAISEVARAGYFSYNLIDGSWTVSKTARALTGLPDEVEDLPEAIAYFRSVMAPADWNKIEQQTAETLTAPGGFNHSIRLERADGTTSLQVLGTSVGNALHVTHLFGSVREAGQTIVTNQQSISGELARFSIDEARDMIFWTRPNGTFSYVNQSAADTLKYDRQHLEGGPITLIAPYFNDEVRTEFWDRLRRERVFAAEYDLVGSGGEQFPISATINYLRFGDEEYACSFCRDVSQQKIRDKRRALVEFTIDRSRDMIVWVRSDNVVHSANATFLRRTGFPRQEVEGQDVLGFFPDLNEDTLDRIRQKLSHGGQVIEEFRTRLSNGATLPTQLTVDRLTYEEQDYLCMYLRDWRVKKERDTIINLSKAALDSATDCIVWLEEDLTIRYINQTLLQLVGGQDTDWLGLPYKRLFRHLSKSDIADGATLEFPIVVRGGATRQLELKCDRLELREHRYYALVGRDVTERLDKQRELEAAMEEVRRLKDKFEAENVTLREEISTGYSMSNIITVSPKYRPVLEKVVQVADVNTTVLINGETGTGKELLAQSIHQLSDRSEKPLIKINCAVLPENLIESELFGHEKGAFTGAVKQKKGRFELADGGTLFLDEVGEMPLDLQAKLLRVLQEDEFERVGGTTTIKVDVRLIAATNRNLEDMVAEGRFRADLYYRLNVFPITNMPLRDRPEDIPVLVEFFAKKFAKRQGKDIKRISTPDMKALQNYRFPGNIRELENLVERAVVLCRSETLSIPLDKQRSAAPAPAEFLTFEAIQRQHIIAALKQTNGRITGPKGAGVLLGLNDRTLMSKMRKLDIQKREYIV